MRIFRDFNLIGLIKNIQEMSVSRLMLIFSFV